MSYSKPKYESIAVSEDSAVADFRVVVDQLPERRRNGDPKVHCGVDVRLADGTRCFIHRFGMISFARAACFTRQDERDPIRYLEDPVWRRPKWNITMSELKYVGDYGECNKNNNCAHAVQRMARAMGWLDDVQRQVEQWVCEGRLGQEALNFMM